MKTNQKSQRPYAVYVVEEGDDAYWTKIGAAWRHEDGKGFNISLSCLPVNGRLVVREPKADAERQLPKLCAPSRSAARVRKGTHVP